MRWSRAGSAGEKGCNNYWLELQCEVGRCMYLARDYKVEMSRDVPCSMCMIRQEHETNPNLSYFNVDATSCVLCVVNMPLSVLLSEAQWTARAFKEPLRAHGTG